MWHNKLKLLLVTLLQCLCWSVLAQFGVSDLTTASDFNICSLRYSSSTIRDDAIREAVKRNVDCSNLDKLNTQPNLRTSANSSPIQEVKSVLPACQGSYRAVWRNCFGTVTYPYGDKYVGEWDDGKYNGQGVLYSSNGSIINHGIWEYGKFVRSVTFQQPTVSNPSSQIANALEYERKKLEDEKRQLAEERRKFQEDSERKKLEEEKFQLAEERRKFEEEKLKIKKIPNSGMAQKNQPSIKELRCSQLGLIQGSEDFKKCIN